MWIHPIIPWGYDISQRVSSTLHILGLNWNAAAEIGRVEEVAQGRVLHGGGERPPGHPGVHRAGRDPEMVGEFGGVEVARRDRRDSLGQLGDRGCTGGCSEVQQ